MYTQGPTVAIYRRGVCRSWPYVISPSLTAMTWIIKFTSDPPTFDRPFFFCISQHTEEEGENKKWNKLIVGIDWGGRRVRGRCDYGYRRFERVIAVIGFRPFLLDWSVLFLWRTNDETHSTQKASGRGCFCALSQVRKTCSSANW